MNVVVLMGRLARPPEERMLPSGDRLVSYQLTVAREGAPDETVPVVWFEAPARALEVQVDETVVVAGRVRRRFFRTGAVTQSRTEVVADGVAPTRQSSRAQALVGRARLQLDDGPAPPAGRARAPRRSASARA